MVGLLINGKPGVAGKAYFACPQNHHIYENKISSIFCLPADGCGSLWPDQTGRESHQNRQ
jgi:hypothetical protein